MIPTEFRSGVVPALAALVACLLVALCGCAGRVPLDIGPGVNRLDAEYMRDIYRPVWGEWLKTHPFRPRPEPQKIGTRIAGETWLFACTTGTWEP